MPLSKLVNTSLGQMVARTNPKTNTATKLPGYGNVPGIGAVGASGVPTFTATPPASGTFAPAQAGQSAQVGSGGSSGVPPSNNADPRDPTYWTEVAKINNTFGNNEASYNLQQTNGQTQLSNTLAALDKQQPVDTSNLRGNYNQSGLFYSSKLGSAEGDLNTKYETNRTNARTGFAGLVNQLNIYRNQNQNENGRGPNGELTGTAFLDALNAGIGRASTADQAASNNNLLAQLLSGGTTDPAAAAAAAPAGVTAPGGMVNGQFQSQILSPQTTALINQWIAATKRPSATSSKAQKTTGR